MAVTYDISIQNGAELHIVHLNIKKKYSVKREIPNEYIRLISNMGVSYN